jgi:two-component system chemotaxis response regulator CheB
MAKPRAIIVIGASAGGVEAVRTVIGALPATMEAAVFVTLHIGAHKSDLPWLLERSSVLPAFHPRDGDEITAGRIYVAPPDHHLVIDNGRVGLSKGPRENWARPAIDPLFRSAAEAYGPRVIGVVLTGGLNDGTAGLIKIKAKGGVTVVQDRWRIGLGRLSAISGRPPPPFCRADAAGPWWCRPRSAAPAPN